MGLLSKFKKKLTKGLRKITPKEIAPLLPLAAMVVPGMGGIMSSSLAKFLVPQLLTAAGSSRTSGKINPLNQVMAGLGSLAGINASNQALQTAATGPSSQIGTAGALKPNALGTGLTASAQEAAAQLANPGLLDKAAAGMSGVPGLGKAMDVTARGQQGLLSLNPFDNTPATFSKSILAPLSAAGGMYMMDAAEAANQKLQEEQAEAAANAAAANEASNDVIAAIARFSDPINRYGNNPYGDFDSVTGQLLNTGGRVGAKDGKFFGKAKPGYGLSKKIALPLAGGVGLGGYGLLSLIDAVRAVAGMADGGRVGMDDGGFLSKLFVEPPIDPDGQEIIRDPSEMGIGSMTLEAIGNLIRGAEFDEEGYVFPRRPNKFRKGIYDAVGFDASNYPGFTDLSETLGYANGGSIPQTTTIPQGMQLEGRGGGFIPMGAQERKDDVPAMLAKNEFVMTADAVRAAGGGSVEKGAQKMYDVMNQLEAQV